jgi:hypothetical protein
MTLIRFPKKARIESPTASNGSIEPVPNSVVLDSKPHPAPANINGPNDEKVQAVSETPQPDGADVPLTNGLDGLPAPADEVVLDDDGLPIQRVQLREIIDASRTEPDDLPGIVDEEPLDPTMMTIPISRSN